MFGRSKNNVEMNGKREMFFCENQFSHTDGIYNFGPINCNPFPKLKNYNPTFFKTYYINNSGVIFNSEENITKQDSQFLNEINLGNFDKRLI